MGTQTELPRYYVKEAAFIAGELRDPGTVLKWGGGYGPHLEPLNDAARAVAEAWYEEEFTYKIDDPSNPGQKLTIKHKPRADLRPVEMGGSVGGPEPTFELENLPQRGTPQTDLSLAQLGMRKGTDQRPGPAKNAVIPAEFYKASAEGPPAEAPIEDLSGAGLEVEIKAPPPTVGGVAQTTITKKLGAR
jgi:hypothetical protein